MTDQSEKILLDTDIGSDIDDAVALAYLLCQPRCDLLGVTTVSGEAELRAEMVSAVCRNVGRDDIPIHAGCSQAILTDILQKTAPQAAALTGWDCGRDFPPSTAIDFLRQTIRANPGEVTLLAIGPMTNVGVLFATDPEIPGLLKRLVLMCGRFFDAHGGEWNAINDPYATALTYGAGCQSVPPVHISFPLDATTHCTLGADECRSRFSAKALAPVRDFAEVWFTQRPEITFHDPLAAVCIFEPDICEYEQGLVSVSITPPTAGWTVIDTQTETKPHTVARRVNAQRFFEHYFSVVS